MSCGDNSANGREEALRARIAALEAGLRDLLPFAPQQSAEWFRNSLNGKHLAPEAEAWDCARALLDRAPTAEVLPS